MSRTRAAILIAVAVAAVAAVAAVRLSRSAGCEDGCADECPSCCGDFGCCDWTGDDRPVRDQDCAGETA
jgi:hypothetical protein